MSSSSFYVYSDTSGGEGFELRQRDQNTDADTSSNAHAPLRHKGLTLNMDNLQAVLRYDRYLEVMQSLHFYILKVILGGLLMCVYGFSYFSNVALEDRSEMVDIFNSEVTCMPSTFGESKTCGGLDNNQFFLFLANNSRELCTAVSLPDISAPLYRYYADKRFVSRLTIDVTLVVALFIFLRVKNDIIDVCRYILLHGDLFPLGGPKLPAWEAARKAKIGAGSDNSDWDHVKARWKVLRTFLWENKLWMVILPLLLILAGFYILIKVNERECELYMDGHIYVKYGPWIIVGLALFACALTACYVSWWASPRHQRYNDYFDVNVKIPWAIVPHHKASAESDGGGGDGTYVSRLGGDVV